MATPKNKKTNRAEIVRRKNKSGNTYFYNKKTKKFSSKSSWYKYRTWAIKQKPSKPPIPKKKEVVDIDLKSSLYKKDIDKAAQSELREEANRLRLEQARLRDKKKSLKLKKNKKVVSVQIRRYARHIDNIEKMLGEYAKPRGFEKESFTIGENVFVDNVYKWEAKKFVDDLIESEDYDLFIIQYARYEVSDPVGIGLAIDELETEADVNDIYYFRITQNTKTRTVHVTLSQ